MIRITLRVGYFQAAELERKRIVKEAPKVCISMDLKNCRKYQELNVKCHPKNIKTS